jgi:hypothetical protein
LQKSSKHLRVAISVLGVVVECDLGLCASGNGCGFLLFLSFTRYMINRRRSSDLPSNDSIGRNPLEGKSELFFNRLSVHLVPFTANF